MEWFNGSSIFGEKMKYDYVDILVNYHDCKVLFEGEMVSGCQVAKAGDPGTVTAYIWHYPEGQHNLYVFCGKIEIIDRDDPSYNNCKIFDAKKFVEEEQERHRKAIDMGQQSVLRFCGPLRCMS